ncbi:hypothetical protein H4R33_002609 [Dimargaris cristalligena]|nr:hypothetical protein H4R33_002609 [Dimargaris cristalligena]
MGKTATCVDVQHKKRGRPKLKDRKGVMDGPVGTSCINPSIMVAPIAPLTSRTHDPMVHHINQFSLAGNREHHYRYQPHTPTAVLPAHRLALEVVVIMSMDYVSLRVTDNCAAILGHTPPEFLERPLTDFLYQDDIPLFLKLRQILLDQLGLRSTISQLSAHTLQTADFYRMPLTSLMVMAKRSSSTQDRMYFRKPDGGGYSLFNVRLHLGGGLGAECNRSDTYPRLYLTCHISPFEFDSLLDPRAAGTYDPLRSLAGLSHTPSLTNLIHSASMENKTKAIPGQLLGTVGSPGIVPIPVTQLEAYRMPPTPHRQPLHSPLLVGPGIADTYLSDRTAFGSPFQELAVDSDSQLKRSPQLTNNSPTGMHWRTLPSLAPPVSREQIESSAPTVAFLLGLRSEGQGALDVKSSDWPEPKPGLPPPS